MRYEKPLDAEIKLAQLEFGQEIRAELIKAKERARQHSLKNRYLPGSYLVVEHVFDAAIYIVDSVIARKIAS